jgi:GH15 family glucan-1,4-alpha-glucosidase
VAGTQLDLVARSLSLVREYQSPNGAYVAGPTFAVYNYCWFRDGAYIAYAMDLAGEHESAARFYGWAVSAILKRIEPAERAIATALAGNAPAAADLLHTRYALDGASGGDDWPNFQLDGFGTLLWGLAEHLRQSNRPLPAEWRPAVDLVARYLSALWLCPCYDCWEEFGEEIHTATLAACFGGLTAAASLLEAERFATTAAAIRVYVRTNCVADGCLTKFVGNPAVDASLIQVATPHRLLAPDDPIMRRTADRIAAELLRGGVHRYAADSYYGGGEWILLTAYLGWYYVESGESERARPLLEWIERQADSAGNLPEQVPANLNYPEMLPVWIERWGESASPLLWSHAAYLTIATYLSLAH